MDAPPYNILHIKPTKRKKKMKHDNHPYIDCKGAKTIAGKQEKKKERALLYL